ncbi:MAG: efflux transporter outer membrane subunit [Akkermansiaceae bacterium]|nr:efflux transporter outer membrane subunit [Akkermansiaceae bacterium]
MKALPIIFAAILLLGCATQPPGPTGPPPAWVNAPHSGAVLSADWWQGFGDPQLGSLVKRAWENNPDIEVALHQIEAARADRFEAAANFLPKAGIELGFREAREQNRDTGFRAVDMKPWTAEGGISWELDLFGKRRAEWRAAKAGEAAAHARLRGVRLLVATEVCAARLEQNLLTRELGLQRQQLEDENEATELSRQLLAKGLISSAAHAKRISDMEDLERRVHELMRLQENARLRLVRLLGGGKAPSPRSSNFALPAIPKRVPAEVWQQRPDLLAAEAMVREAFAVADSARLNLLPTLSLSAGGSLASSSPRDSYEVWMASVGPKLDIPIWDPARIAQVKRGKARAAEAAARYRSTSDRAVEEIESAYNDSIHHRHHMESLEREAAAKRKAWQDSQAKYQAGLDSAIQRTDLGRSYANTAIMATRMRIEALHSQLRLIRALGGGK